MRQVLDLVSGVDLVVTLGPGAAGRMGQQVLGVDPSPFGGRGSGDRCAESRKLSNHRLLTIHKHFDNMPYKLHTVNKPWEDIMWMIGPVDPTHHLRPLPLHPTEG